jgi:hypothetical protein
MTSIFLVEKGQVNHRLELQQPLTFYNAKVTKIKQAYEKSIRAP